MKKSKWVKPYARRGVTNLTEFKARSGVYLIRKEGQRQISYVGYSGSDLYKTITRHFQSWVDPQQQRVTYPQEGYLVRIVLCTKKQALALETALRAKHKPTDNPEELPIDYKTNWYERTTMEAYTELPELRKSEFDPYFPF